MNILSLDPQNGTDCRTLRIRDTSVYENKENVFNAILEIKIPGESCFKAFDVSLGFDMIFNCKSLNICCETCPEGFTDLPDGNYELKYSVAPNETTMVEFNYFRNCSQFKKYLNKSCELFSNKSSDTPKEFKKKVEALYELKELINSAKYSAEDCLDVDGALELYDEANKKLINAKGCTNC